MKEKNYSHFFCLITSSLYLDRAAFNELSKKYKYID